MFPAVPVAPANDAALYMENAVRMLHGEVIYRDFFQFTPPGTECVYWFLFRIFGIRAWIGDAVLVLLGTGLAWLSLAISRKILKGRMAFLPGVLFLTFMFRGVPDAKETWFGMLAVIAALALALEGQSLPRLAGVGALCGLAGWFSQTDGLAGLLAILAFLVWQGRNAPTAGKTRLHPTIVVAGVFVGTLIALNAYFAWMAGLGRFLYCTILFGSKYYSADVQANSLAAYFSVVILPRLHPWWRLSALVPYLFVHLLVPLVYLLFVAAWWRQKNSLPGASRGALMLINFFGVFLFLSIASAPIVYHLYAVALPGLMLLVWLGTTWGKFGRVFLSLLWLAGILSAIETVTYRQVRWRGYLESPVGRMAILDPGTFEECKWVQRHIKPGWTLYEGGSHTLYFVLGLPHPAPVPFITGTDYTRPEQVQELIEALKTRPVQFFFWQADLDVSGAPASQNHLVPLRRYLRSNFHAVRTFKDFDEVWERNP